MKTRKIDVRVLRDIPEGVEVGSEQCACGNCRPTATIYKGDPNYEHHNQRLAQGPCCCDRFFVVGFDAEEHARAMAAERRGADAYRFERHDLALPWAGLFPSSSATSARDCAANSRGDRGPSPFHLRPS